MSRPLKIVIYAVLAACLILFGLLAARTYNRDREKQREKISQAADTNLVDDFPTGTPPVRANGGGSWALYGAIALGSLVVLAACTAAGAGAGGSPSAAPRGFTPLFNGRDLSGWRGRP